MGIVEIMQPLRRDLRKPQQNRSPRRGGDTMLWRISQDFGTVAIGNDQADVGRYHGYRDLRRDRKEKPVAVPAVIGPFFVCATIRNGRFDLNNVDPSVAA
jgi:hypothetical protein